MIRRFIGTLFRKPFREHSKKAAVDRIKLPSFENNTFLERLHNIHAGRRAFLLGNGPSLCLEDIDKLKDEITFASNKIYLLYPQTEWRPTYLTVIDELVSRNINRELLEAGGSTKIFGAGVSKNFRPGCGITFTNWPKPEGEAEWNPVKGIKGGHSVVNFDIKLAYWMGIRELYVIGLDFSFVTPSKTTGEKVYGNDVLLSEGEVNHFHPDYRKPGETWTSPKLEEQRHEFAFALDFMKARGGRIYNASRRSKLDCWPLVNLDDIL